jgi:hypothetical protein
VFYLTYGAFAYFMFILKAVTNAYYRGANGCMLVYDISKEKTFQAV